MKTDDNAILNFSELPRFAEIRPDQADAAVDAVLATLAQAAAAVAAAPPEWDDAWVPLSDAEEAVARVWNQIQHMHAVMSVESWREVYKNNLEKITAAFAQLGQHEGVHAKLRELSETPAAARMSPVRQKILHDALRDFQLSGVDLPSGKKEQFRKNSEELSSLSAKFEDNLLDATADNPLDIDDESMLGDMPADLKTAARREEGGFRFTLMQPSYAAFMQYSPARDQRREMYYRYNTRASSLGPAARDNTPLIDAHLALRKQQAQLLGFDNYAEYALQTRMAESPRQVLDFLHDLTARALPAARREMEEMRDFAGTLGLTDLNPWDVPFVADHLRRERFDFSSAELRPYLQVDRVLDGLFSCIQKLFGAQLQSGDAARWLPETKFLQVRENDKITGGLYLDLFARKSKRGGAWMGEALSRCLRHGRLQLPAAHVVCNFTPPADGAAAVLNWEEAQTLFHEFGHALHHLLTAEDEYAASGMNGVEWDAVELPSQFMENFIWHWPALEPMTAHIDTGAPMPKALFDKALSARRFHAGLQLLRQLEFALFDLSLHADEPRPFMAVLKEVREHTQVLPVPEWNHYPCGFAHIFSGGYAAGYYSYLWAETLSADMFAMFEESGDTLNPELGRRFRREVLAAGGGRSAMESFVAARGRAPDSSALLKHYGLAV